MESEKDKVSTKIKETIAALEELLSAGRHTAPDTVKHCPYCGNHFINEIH